MSLIEKLGKRGATFNKVGGSGLGLHYAMATIETWGGKIVITSIEAVGTTVEIFIPKEMPSDWFVPYLKLKSGDTLIVFDDDSSIHQIWNERIDSFSCMNIKVVHLNTPKEMRKYYGLNFADLEDVIYLMDFEILNHSETGLDLIEELGIQKQSILVTSRYEESSVRDRCEQIGVKLIPKSMSGFVPIVI